MSTVQILRGHKPAQFPQIPEPGSSSRDAAGAAEPEKELERDRIIFLLLHVHSDWWIADEFPLNMKYCARYIFLTAW